MARIGPIKKHSQANPPYERKRRINEENLATSTPPTKCRRFGLLATATIDSPHTVNNNDINSIKELLHGISDDLGQDTTASYILSNVAVLLKLVFGEDESDLCEAIDTLMKEHLGLHSNVSVTPVHGITNQPTPVAMAPAPIAKETVIAVPYNPRIFQLSPINPNLPALRGSHGRVNLHRLKTKLVETLKDCGTLEHQLYCCTRC